MRFEYRSQYFPDPSGPEQFIRPGCLDIHCWPENDDSVVVGRLALDHLDLYWPISCGEEVYTVCDADSSGWEGVYRAVLEKVGSHVDVRRDLEFDEHVSHVLFIHRAIFHPVLREWQAYIIDHACRLIDCDSITVMWEGTTDLTGKELADLGFSKIAGEELLFRPNMLVHDYQAINDSREPFNLIVPGNAQQFVDKAWGDDLGWI